MTSNFREQGVFTRTFSSVAVYQKTKGDKLLNLLLNFRDCNFMFVLYVCSRRKNVRRQGHQKTVYECVRFQVLMAASMMFRIVFWDVLPCKMMIPEDGGSTHL
jgi:hypothetical protein